MVRVRHKTELSKSIATLTCANGGDATFGGAADSSTTTNSALHVALPASFSVVTENRPASSSNTSGMYSEWLSPNDEIW